MNVHNVATTASFMTLGMTNPPRETSIRRLYNILDTWGKGCLELFGALAEYAVLSEAYLLNYADDEYPGVYDYEVSEPFGQWFGDYILEYGDAPTIPTGKAKLLDMIDAFFKQGK